MSIKRKQGYTTKVMRTAYLEIRKKYSNILNPLSKHFFKYKETKPQKGDTFSNTTNCREKLFNRQEVEQGAYKELQLSPVCV